MKSKKSPESPDSDLKKLEYRVDELIQVCDRLREENGALRARHANIMAERSDLVEKSRSARSRVETMIMRLKAMEQIA